MQQDAKRRAPRRTAGPRPRSGGLDSWAQFMHFLERVAAPAPSRPGPRAATVTTAPATMPATRPALAPPAPRDAPRHRPAPTSTPEPKPTPPSSRDARPPVVPLAPEATLAPRPPASTTGPAASRPLAPTPRRPAAGPDATAEPPTGAPSVAARAAADPVPGADRPVAVASQARPRPTDPTPSVDGPDAPRARRATRSALPSRPARTLVLPDLAAPAATPASVDATALAAAAALAEAEALAEVEAVAAVDAASTDDARVGGEPAEAADREPPTWEAWLAEVRSARRFDPLPLAGLWEGVRPSDRATLLANARAALAARGEPDDPWRDQPNADPPHLYAPKLARDAHRPSPQWFNVASGATGLYPMSQRALAGLKSEVVAIDDMIVSTSHTMHRNGLDWDIAVPPGVDRRAVLPASIYDPWLAPEPWQLADKVERTRVVEHRQSVDLLATPSEVALATQWPASVETDRLRAVVGTVGSDAAPAAGDPEAGRGLRRLLRTLLERKAVLLSVLRGVAQGRSIDHPELWRGRPWVAEFSPLGLFAGEAPGRGVVATPADLALVDDLVRRLLEPGGTRLVDALGALSARHAATRDAATRTLLDGGPDDPPTRVQVTGRARRPRDARLSEEARRILFADHPAVPGSAGHPDFVLPVGCVVVLPGGRPAHLRGRGWSTTIEGRLVAGGPGVDHPDRAMPFHLPRSLREAALRLGPAPEPGFSPGPRAVYYRGYRWVLRRGGGPRRWDETESEGVERAERALGRAHAAIRAGWPGPTPMNPFRLPGRADTWPFGPASSDGPLPDQLRELFAVVGGPYHPDAFGPGTARGEAWPVPPPVAFPGSWDRSWENREAFEERWARAAIPPEVLAAAPFARRLGAPAPAGDQRSVREVLSELRAAARASVAAELARGSDDAYASRNRATVTAARERAALMRQIDDEDAERASQADRTAATRIHRDRGREAATERRARESEARARTCRLAYVPDPEVDGASAEVVVIPYDPAFRPEDLPGLSAEATPLLGAPPVDHARGPTLDPPLPAGARPPYRASEVDRYMPHLTGG